MSVSAKIGKVLLGAIVGGAAVCWLVATEEVAGQPSPVPSGVAAQASGGQQVEKVKSRDAVRARLDGTAWVLELTQGAEQKPLKDTLTFEGRTVTSKRLSKAGYNTSNYSLTIGDDGIAVWETMQSKEGEGVASWRGELHGESMRGILSQQPIGGQAENFSFTATPVKAVEPQEEVRAQPPAAESAVTESEVSEPDVAVAEHRDATTVEEPKVQETPKKKKKRWGLF